MKREPKWYTFAVKPDSDDVGFVGELYEVRLGSSTDVGLIEPVGELTHRTWFGESETECLDIFLKRDLPRMFKRGDHVIIAGLGQQD
jgi:hypothetical protein